MAWTDYWEMRIIQVWVPAGFMRIQSPDLTTCWIMFADSHLQMFVFLLSFCTYVMTHDDTTTKHHVDLKMGRIGAKYLATNNRS